MKYIVMAILVIRSVFEVTGQSVVSQHVFASGGNEYHSAHTILSSTLGEAFIFDGQASQSMVCQGFQSGAAFLQTAIIDLNNESINIEFYPNPASDYIHVSWKSESIREVMLVSVTGQEINHSRVQHGASSVMLDVNGIAKGVYALFCMDAHQHRAFAGWIVIQ